MSQGASSTLVQRLDALYEYEREPIKQKDLHGWKIFWATFAGEHIAGTEFVLGPLFVMHGATAFDVLVGLLCGNVLAVLSWALVCAPISVKTRLTIYWELRKIGGPWLTVAYSALYGVVLCLLAGAMVNVSMTAISIPFGIPNPEVGVSLPMHVWIQWGSLAVLVGTTIAVLAVVGFEGMAIFSKMSAPWMVAVFIAAGIATLPALGCESLGDFWRVANEKIWTGTPASGYSQYTFWHIMGFAWLCNITQHLGMADMTILRFARKWQMGFCSSAGMFLGHYCAWIASGILCAAWMAAQSAAGVADPHPTAGLIAILGAGFAGALCVVVAGWNVASPTLYRAGLALQVATPNWRRWAVTLVVGTAMIICACIPAIIDNLDRIVGYYGLLFMPLGAFIFIDVWLFPKIGLRAGWAERTRALISWPATLAWIGSLLFSLFVYGKDNYPFVQDLLAGHLPAWLDSYKPDLFFLVLPEWIIAVTLYVVFCTVQQKAFGTVTQPSEAEA
jgi:purine-cytosine permease-like protein